MPGGIDPETVNLPVFSMFQMLIIINLPLVGFFAHLLTIPRASGVLTFVGVYSVDVVDAEIRLGRTVPSDQIEDNYRLPKWSSIFMFDVGWSRWAMRPLNIPFNSWPRFGDDGDRTARE